eukprot:UN3659
MAADKHRIGNIFLAIREDHSGIWSLAAQNAADENNTRRSSLLPWVLIMSAPRFDWTRLPQEDVREAETATVAAEDYLSMPSKLCYDQMIGLYRRMLARGALAKANDRRWMSAIPDCLHWELVEPAAGRSHSRAADGPQQWSAPLPRQRPNVQKG